MRKYQLLRELIRAERLTAATLSEMLEHGPQHISECMRGKCMWRVEDCYKILDILNEPRSRIFEVFPPGGFPEKPKGKDPDETIINLARAFAGVMASSTPKSLDHRERYGVSC